MTELNIIGPARMPSVATILWGDEAIFSPCGGERAARCLVVALFLALPLFVAVQLSPTAWAPATALILCVVHPRLLKTGLLYSLWRPLACWLAFAAFAAISAKWSLDPSRSWKAGLVLVTYVGVAALIISYIAALSPSQRNRVWIALVAGAVIALIELTAIEIYSVLARWDAARTFHKISFYGLLAAAVLLRPEAKEARVWKIFLLTFFAIPTLLIGKTTGVNLLILATVALYFLPALQRPRLLLAVFLFYCLLALSAPFLVDLVFDWVDQSFVSRLKSVASFMARLDLWRLMAPYILEHPWFGHGADTVRVSEFIVRHVKYYDLPDLPSAHNMVFDQWYELGLVGIVSLLSILGMTLWDITASACRYNLSAAVIFLGFIVELSVDHRIWLSWVQGTAVFAASVTVLMALRTSDQTCSVIGD